MRHAIWGVLALAAALCGTTADAAQPKAADSFREGMAYADLRQRLVDSGWVPLRDPKCWENVGGEAEVCNAVPEVASCSGDGYCTMVFVSRAENARMRVGTYGAWSAWDKPGSLALTVRFWEASALPAPATPSAACPSRDFDAFLKAFASDAAVRQAFTAPLVRVVELSVDADGGDKAVPVDVSGPSYDGFNLVYRGGAFHFIDHEGKADPKPLKLAVRREAPRSRFVGYLYGMSEGNSYRFEDKGDCWYLTEDPEAPSP